MSEQRLYREFADWWHLLSPVHEYEEEARIYTRIMHERATGPCGTLLEIGSGGGNNASFMKRHFDITLVDRSDNMLAQSRRINPELEHRVGDMRSVRLGREFDAVFIQDAIAYMTSVEDLRRAFETAAIHCRPGGVALFAPDHLVENYKPATNCGGSDGGDRAVRYLEWDWDPDPADTTHTTDYCYALRHPDGSMTVEFDRHVQGLFPRQVWLDALSDAGFDARSVPFDHSELEPGSYELFVCVRREV